MTPKLTAEHGAFFDLSGPAGALQIDLEGGMIRIVSRKETLSIPQGRLLRIEHCPVSWCFGSSEPGLRIRFLYRNGRGEAKAEVTLAADDPQISPLIHCLENRFPEQACFEPHAAERIRTLSKNQRAVYGLHALHIWTPAGIILGLLLVTTLVLSIILAESMPVRTVSDRALQQALLVILCLAVIPAVLMILLAVKALMTIRTDSGGLTLRRLFGKKRFSWGDMDVGEPHPGAFNVYTGMFCYYSDWIDVVSSRSLLEIPLRCGREVHTVTLNLEEAVAFVRELYYRGKVTLETARKAGAFL